MPMAPAPTETSAISVFLADDNLIVREGVLSRKGIDVPLIRVIGNTATRTLLQRVFRSGRLTIATASPTKATRPSRVKGRPSSGRATTSTPSRRPRLAIGTPIAWRTPSRTTSGRA